jgi:cell division protein FtsL
VTATATARARRAAPRGASTPVRSRGATALAYAPAHAPTSAPSPRHLRVVEAPNRRARRRRRRVKLVGVAAVGAVFTVVAFHAFLAQNQIALDRLEQQTAEAQQRYQEQRLENAQLKSPARIMAEATALGLQPAGPPTPIPTTDLPATDSSTGTDDYANAKPTLAP